MNREEAKQEIDKHYVTSVSTEDVKLIRVEVAHRVIDEIFDYFESKTCENCKHHNRICKLLGVGDIGGCGDYWESKDESK